jgi:hypothetical protein
VRQLGYYTIIFLEKGGGCVVGGSEPSDKNRDNIRESNQCRGRDSNRIVEPNFSVDFILNLAGKVIAFL